MDQIIGLFQSVALHLLHTSHVEHVSHSRTDAVPEPLFAARLVRDTETCFKDEHMKSLLQDTQVSPRMCLDWQLTLCLNVTSQ